MNIDEKKLDEELNDIVSKQRLADAKREMASMDTKKKLDNLKHNLERFNYLGFLLAQFGPPGIIDYETISADKIAEIAEKVTEFICTLPPCGQHEVSVALCLLLSGLSKKSEAEMGANDYNHLLNMYTAEFVARLAHEEMLNRSRSSLEHKHTDECGGKEPSSE